ncbi:Permease of the drug/metabolite transporter (DMT) superfamily [Natronorubrum sediminis]|uniref:Permease of the drug/metabolite transporter (DMT) superfamily n=1 Tax=Natronorubrum sediminis TaxID=640943 RepID=A0A1H6FIP8_9EURY|nr:EamA family transporter [Natronorubrum sediminis]SEH10729.1 Permease of the drug/metabolite transporter (DMT) superfamily [Natronorubrum sediminis]
MTHLLSRRSEYRELVLFSILALCWGSSFVAIEVGLEYVPPLLFAGFRYLVAGAIVFAYAVVATDRIRPRTRGEWLIVSIAGVFVIGLYHGLLYLGELYVSGAVAATVVSTAPILTVVFASLLLPNQRINGLSVIGFVLGLVGVILVVRPSPASLHGDMTYGAILVLGAAITFALGSVLVRPIESALPIETLQAWAMLIGAGVLFAWAGVRGESMAGVELTTTALLSYAYLTIISGVFAFLLYFELLEQSGPTQVNLVGYAEPAVAIVVSWLVLGSIVDSITIVGLLTILVGFLVIKRNAIRSALVSARSGKPNRGLPETHVETTAKTRVEASTETHAKARTDGGVIPESDSSELPNER